jgi:thymidylate synthase
MMKQNDENNQQKEEKEEKENIQMEEESPCKPFNEELQYLYLIRHILDRGSDEVGRNGITRSVFGSHMRFSLENNSIPIITTKKTAWKTCLKELLWFIRGETSVSSLQKENVHIWDGNADKAFLESRNLSHYEEGDLGPIYGFQWRHFGAEWSNSSAQYERKGVDQLQMIIDQLKNSDTRTSRRLVMTAWNPTDLDKMVLPPCHILCQFNVHGGNKLSCSMYQRSGDVGLGVPFNIASYSFLTHLIAAHCDLVAHEFVYFLGNAHIYDDHYDALREQLRRKPFTFPTLKKITKRENINDYDVSDFVVEDYVSHDKIHMDMRA